MADLYWLKLDQTQVGDRGLLHLKGLKNLTILNLFGAKVTSAGVKDLKQARPSLLINR